MNLKQLETLYWIGRLGSFSAVAEQLNTTQSNVSMRILRLEEELGAKLFHRAAGKPRLTQKGRAMMDLAARAVSLSTDIHHLFGSPAPLTGMIKVGISEIIAVTWLPELMTCLKDTFPNLTVTLDMDFTGAMRRKLEHGDLDLVLIPGPINLPGIRTEYLGSVSYRWFAARRLRLPTYRLSPSDLIKLPLITLPGDSILHTVTDSWFKAAGVRTRYACECNSLGLIVALVHSGLGISLLPDDITTDLIDHRRVCPLETVPAIPPIKYYAAYLAPDTDSVVEPIAKLAAGVSTFSDVSHTRSKVARRSSFRRR